jgi:putative transposase
LLAELGITKTHSRPYTSDDNPFSESNFKTLKYCPNFPERFGCQEDAVGFCRAFFRWYNNEHKHSGINRLTPTMVHYGEAQKVLAHRNRILKKAFERNPARFKYKLPDVGQLPSEVWINPPKVSAIETDPLDRVG